MQIFICIIEIVFVLLFYQSNDAEIKKKKMRVRTEMMPNFLEDFIQNPMFEFIENANAAIDFQTRHKQIKLSDRSLEGLKPLKNEDIKIVEQHRSAYGEPAYQILDVSDTAIKVLKYFEVECQAI